MSRFYTYNKQLTNPGTTNPVIQVGSGSGFVYRVHKIQITQNNSTTSGNSEVKVQRLSAGATVTAAAATDWGKHSSGDGNIGLTFSTSTTGFTGSTTGTTTGAPIIQESFNILNGYLWLPTPAFQIEIPPSGWLALSMPTAAAAVYDFEITLEEIG
jgi:hypothetical protein